MGGQGLVFIISGPSGSGKTTLVKRLLANRRLAKNLKKATSFTTRPIRKNETEGKDYFFLNREDFKHRQGQGEFLETKEIAGNFYGVSKQEVSRIIEPGKDVLLCIDVRGARDIKEFFPKEKVVSIFILPPSLDILLERLKYRSSESKCQIHRRMALARQEAKSAFDYDYVVINNKLETALKKLEAIVASERVRRLPD